MKDFAFKLNKAIKSSGLKQKDLYDLTGMTKQGFISMKRNGTPKAETLGIIANALGVPVSYFFEHDNTKTK